jgi:hypothetical protein
MKKSIGPSILFCLFTIVAAVLWAGGAEAQLVDPWDKKCYYPPGSTVCVPLPPPGQAQPQPPPPPPRPMGNACEANCQGQQQQCMNRCTAQNDWYRCFAYCGEVRTTCLRQCPLRF